MARSFVSIKVLDKGEYNNSLAKLYLEKEYDGEEPIGEKVFIRYGWFNRDQNFYPCCILQHNGMICLHKAGIGKLGDIKVNEPQWLKILVALRSKILLNQWKETISRKVAA